MAASKSVEGKAAVVTGGSRGIGRAVAEALAMHGASVIVNGRDESAIDEAVRAIVDAGGSAHGCAGSAADFDVAGSLVETCIDRFGAIDILVNCAGTAEPPGSSILDLSFTAWQELIGAHLTTVFNTCRHAAPHMVRKGSGSIVNTSSHAYVGIYGGSGYPAGKGGTNSLTFALAAELREHGIRVNAVCPGARTRLSTGPEYERHIERLHARGILDDATRAASLAPADPEHAAPLYVLLASDLARDVTGKLFSAAGGYVGVHAAPTETLIGFRQEADGPWPVEELAKKVLAVLPNAH
ncbi:MAG: SDR family NAD(P)-dependent oxidoreductase [Candidatus Binatia bacterium]|nr:SDR family NAD(P)-dependent oxidoreductase [Candidatus Binatia bacterium]